MSKGASVMERSVVHAGKVFIKEGEENNRAYVIQTGKVRAFTMQDDNKIEIATYGPGTIIGEVCLVLDEPIRMSFETLVDTTVVMITRQDFERKLQKVDTSIKTILRHVMNKLNNQAEDDKALAFKNAKIENEAFDLTRGILHGMSDDKKLRYEAAILPIMNDLVKTLKKLKKNK